ncbi:type II secretion system protein [bacterium]|nr:type II secretion system protein [bacterium]
MKKAFTLAEVLAALAIVGVIASVTVPTLQAGYQDRKYKSLVKKAHLTLQQAYDATILEDKIRKARAGLGFIYWLAVDSYVIDGITYDKEEPSLRIMDEDNGGNLGSIKTTDGMIIQDSKTLNPNRCNSCSTSTACAIYVDVDGASGPTASDVTDDLQDLDNDRAADIMVFQCRDNMIMPPPLGENTPAAIRTRVHLGIEED